MTFTSFEAWWWPYLFILVAGWLATDGWRFVGVNLGGRISEQSEALVFVRALATALVAAVISNLVVFPGGALGEVNLALRIGAVAVGFAAYLLLARRVIVGILVAEAVLIAGIWLGGGL